MLSFVPASHPDDTLPNAEEIKLYFVKKHYFMVKQKGPVSSTEIRTALKSAAIHFQDRTKFKITPKMIAEKFSEASIMRVNFN